MTISVPPAMNLAGNVVAVSAVMLSDPAEGKLQITQVADWSVPVARGLVAFNVNLQNNATLAFRQICGLIVDNSMCGSDVQFVFPDSDVTITIPAYAPYTVVQVLTRQTQFFVIAPGAIAGDITRYSILNFSPAPVAVPVSISQLVAIVNSVPFTGTGTTAIIPTGVNGSLRGFTVSALWLNPAANFNNSVSLVDGSGTTLWSGNAAALAASGGNVILADTQGLSVRFRNGLNLVQAGGFTTNGTLDASVYYRKP